MLPAKAVFFLLITAECATAADADSAVRSVRSFNFRSVRLAVADLSATFGDRYPNGGLWLRRLCELEHSRAVALAVWDRKAPGASESVGKLAAELERLRYDGLA